MGSPRKGFFGACCSFMVFGLIPVGVGAEYRFFDSIKFSVQTATAPGPTPSGSSIAGYLIRQSETEDSVVFRASYQQLVTMVPNIRQTWGYEDRLVYHRKTYTFKPDSLYSKFRLSGLYAEPVAQRGDAYTKVSGPFDLFGDLRGCEEWKSSIHYTWVECPEIGVIKQTALVREFNGWGPLTVDAIDGLNAQGNRVASLVPRIRAGREEEGSAVFRNLLGRRTELLSPAIPVLTIHRRHADP